MGVWQGSVNSNRRSVSHEHLKIIALTLGDIYQRTHHGLLTGILQKNETFQQRCAGHGQSCAIVMNKWIAKLCSK